ncbi:unnamed protein product [Tenebrio molitor]|nr:unnamed protein product [Tenebrio molitor]
MPHLSDIDKARVVSHLENGRPITNLAAEFGVGKSSIYRIKNKWEIERSQVQVALKPQMNSKMRNY